MLNTTSSDLPLTQRWEPLLSKILHIEFSNRL